MFFLPYEPNAKLTYTLGWSGEGVIVETCQDNIGTIQEYTSAEASYPDNELGLEHFISVGKGSWGFGAALFESNPVYGNGVAWECKFPTDNRDGELLYNHSATLDLLFRALHNAQTPLDAQDLQRTIVYGMKPFKRMCGGSIEVRLMPAMLSWLATQSAETLKPAADAMHEAMGLLNPRWKDSQNDWRIRLMDEGYVLAKCGSGLYPDHGHHLRLGTSQLVTTNSDSPLRQLEILAGIAKIDQMARNA